MRSSSFAATIIAEAASIAQVPIAFRSLIVPFVVTSSMLKQWLLELVLEGSTSSGH